MVRAAVIALQPITITGSPQTVNLAQLLPRFGGQVAPMRFANESPYALQLQLGGDVHWIDPWTVDVFTPAQRVTSFLVTPSILTSPLPSVPSSVVLVTLAEGSETFAGSYPSSLLRQSAAYGQPQLIASLVSPGNNTGTITLPAGTQSLAIVTQIQSGDTSFMSLTGASSGFVYYSQALGSSAFEIIGVESAIDQQLTYQVAHGTGAGAAFFITALTSPPPSFIERTPASWQVPTTVTTINQNLGHGTTFNWVTPPAGRSLRIFRGFLMWETSTAGFGRILGSGVTGTMQQYDQKAQNWLQMDYGGKLLAANEVLQITNDDAGNGQNVNGYVATSLD